MEKQELIKCINYTQIKLQDYTQIKLRNLRQQMQDVIHFCELESRNLEQLATQIRCENKDEITIDADNNSTTDINEYVAEHIPEQEDKCDLTGYYSFSTVCKLLIDHLTTDYKFTRDEWEDDTYITIQRPDDNSMMTERYIYMEVDGKKIPWTPTMQDMISNDWLMIE